MRVLTFDVGGSAIKYGLMVDGELSHQGKVPTPTRHEGREAFLVALEGIIDEMGGASALDGIAMSLPGTIDTEARHINTGGAILYNYDVDATEWERRFGVPLEIENDARCAVIAEYTAGNLQGVRQGMVLAFGTGIGGGIILDGEVYKGAHLYAGEASMVVFRPRATGDAACDLFNKNSFGGYGSVSLVARIAAAKGAEAMTGQEAMALVDAGDPEVCAIFDAYLEDVARTIHNIQCFIDPERICLGGGISQNETFTTAIRAAVERFNSAEHFGIAFPVPEIMPCRYFNDANLVGAYYHFLRARAARAAA